MTFDPDRVNDFLEIFDRSKEKIRAFPGCEHLKLLQGRDASNVFFTYSIWQDEQALESYRHSLLFKETWAATKVLFAAKPEAWSTNLLHEL